MKHPYFYPTLDCLSSDMLQNVTGKDIKVLNQLFILFRIAKKDLTIKYLYIQPSELYIKSKTGYSVCGISRSITKLTAAGLIQTTHRRMKFGKWQTNIYHLGEKILAMVPWMRKYLNKKAPSPFDQTSKLDEQTSLLKGTDTEELMSFSEWKRQTGYKDSG